MSHTVVVEPVPYTWLVDALAVVRSSVEESQAERRRLVLPDGQSIPGVQLTRGRHLRPGAEYLISDQDEKENEGAEHGGTGANAKDVSSVETVTVRVEEWDRRRAVRLALAMASDAGEVELQIVLKSLDRPRLVEIRGQSLFDGVPLRLSQMKGRVRVQLDDWWAAADAAGTSHTAPATARVVHRWARATARAVPRPHRDGDGDRWDVRVTVSLHGRGLLRPLAAVALVVAGRRIRRFVARTLDDLADTWNATVPGLVAMNKDDLRAALTMRPSSG
ncbi:hypothetical protein [Streptomyces sp. NPDC003393]